MFKVIIGTILVGVLSFGIYLVNYLGVFKTVEISVAERPEIVVIGKKHSGAYHKIVPIIEEVETWAKRNEIPCRLSFGEFEDDPRNTEEIRLRSFGGCIVTVEPTLQLPPDFLFKKFPAQKYVIGTFSGSPGIGPLKVYPKIEEFIQESRLERVGSIMEIYEIKSPTEMMTEYLFPVKN